MSRRQKAVGQKAEREAQGYSGFAAFRAERLCLSGIRPIPSRLCLCTEAQPQNLLSIYGKAQPYRTEGGKAAFVFLALANAYAFSMFDEDIFLRTARDNGWRRRAGRGAHRTHRLLGRQYS